MLDSPSIRSGLSQGSSTARVFSHSAPAGFQLITVAEPLVPGYQYVSEGPWSSILPEEKNRFMMCNYACIREKKEGRTEIWLVRWMTHWLAGVEALFVAQHAMNQYGGGFVAMSWDRRPLTHCLGLSRAGRTPEKASREATVLMPFERASSSCLCCSWMGEKNTDNCPAITILTVNVAKMGEVHIISI